jgi:hypothetical protein
VKKVLLLLLVAVALGGFLLVRAMWPNGELKAAVESVAPERHDTLECSWGSSSFEDEADSYYGCTYFAPGKLRQVARILAARAARNGFAVTCHTGRRLVAVTATRGATTVYADVRTPGFARFRSHHLAVPADPTDPTADVVASSDVEIPPRSVLVDVSAHENAPWARPDDTCATI